jgi:hypothetical protein
VIQILKQAALTISNPKEKKTRMQYSGGGLMRGMGITGGSRPIRKRKGGRGTEGNFTAASNNPWIAHVKEFARQNGLTYGQALSDPGVSNDYQHQAGYDDRKNYAMQHADRWFRPKGVFSKKRRANNGSKTRPRGPYVRAPRASDVAAGRRLAQARAARRAAAQ